MDIKGVCANVPSDTYLYDWVKCDECAIIDKCKIKEDNRTGCHFGVENVNNKES